VSIAGGSLSLASEVGDTRALSCAVSMSIGSASRLDDSALTLDSDVAVRSVSAVVVCPGQHLRGF
jgi:hypothetical protein